MRAFLVVYTLIFPSETYKVGLSGDVDFHSLTEAVTTVQYGDEIIVAPGEYSIATGERYPISIRPGIVISGQVEGSFPILIGDNASSIFRGANIKDYSTKIEGLWFKNGAGTFYDNPAWPGPSQYPFGGGMFLLDCNISVNNCIFSENTSLYGGGIACFHGKNVISSCVFQNNECEGGSGLYLDFSASEIFSCQFRGNRAPNWRGAGAVIVGPEIVAPFFSSCVFFGNSSQSGGALYGLDSNVILANCTFSNNRAENQPNHQGAATSGGGVLFHGGVPTMVNCTIVNNYSRYFSGGLGADNTRLIVRNTINWGNSPPQIGAAKITYSLIEGGYRGVGNIDADPLLIDPIGNDLHLQATSPCIDAGSELEAPGEDFDHESRPNPDTGLVDIGADEFYAEPAPTVTPTGIPTPATPTFSPTNTPTISPSETPAPTPLPRNSFLGGYWDTSLAGGQAGAFNIVALAPEATGMEVYAGGSPTGVMVPPFGPGGLFWLLYPSVSPPPEASGTRAYLELVAMYPPPDPWQSWPALTVRP